MEFLEASRRCWKQNCPNRINVKFEVLRGCTKITVVWDVTQIYFCGSFHDADSSSSHIRSNNRLMMYGELQTIWKELVVAYGSTIQVFVWRA
jgi:hypothetical protein